jgi:PAS domain S-box-containing protein/putative nucleotidyltransferase with HDIG domain
MSSRKDINRAAKRNPPPQPVENEPRRGGMPSGKAPLLNPYQILLVDDNPQDRELVERELHVNFPECNVLNVGNHSDLLETLKVNSPDLVISDYHMPWADGLQIFRQIREQNHSCPVIIYSGTGNDQIAAEALKAGVDDYVVKSNDRLPQLMMSARLALERTREQRAAVKAEDRFQFLFQSLPLGLLFIAARGQIMDANPRMAALLGYPDRESLLAAKSVNFFENDEAEADFHRELWNRNSMDGYELRLRRKDGSLNWCRFFVHPVQPEQGEPPYFEAAVEDIQARKEAAEALQLSESRLSLVFDSVSDMLMLLSVESEDTFRVITVNQAVVKSTGHSAESMTGHITREFLSDPVSRVTTEKLHSALHSHDSLRFILSTRPRNHSRICMEAILTPIKNAEGMPRHLLVVARDITARLKSEREIHRVLRQLRESEHRYRSLAEAANDQIFILDRDGNVLYVNPLVSRLFHQPESEIIGKNMRELFPPAVAERQMASVRSIFINGEPSYHEAMSVNPNGEIWLGTWLVPIRDSEGGIASVLGVARDITQRIQSEKAVRESEEQYRSLVQTSPDAIFLHGRDAALTFANQRALEILRYDSTEELRGMYLLDMVCPEERSLAEENLRTLLQTGILRNATHHMVRKDGSTVPVEMNASLILDASGRMKAITSVVRDITERRNRERAQRESEAMFRAIFEKAAFGIVLIGMDGRLIEANESICELLEISRDDLTQRTLEQITHPEDRSSEDGLTRSVARSERDHFQQELQLLRKDGLPVWCRLTVSAVMDSSQAPIYLVGMVEDISQRLQAEQATRQTGESLRRSADRLETLHELDRAILEAHSPEEIASATLDRIHRLVPCQRSSLVLFDREAGTATILDAHMQVESGLGKGTVIPLSQYGSEIDLLGSGQLYSVEDLLAVEQPSATDRQLLADGIRTYLSIPLLSQGILIGALNIGSGIPGAFTREHAEIAAEVGDLLAVGIQQSRLFTQVRRHTFELESVAAFYQDLRLAPGRREICEVVVRHTAKILKSDYVALLEYDPAGESFSVMTASTPAAVLEGERVPIKNEFTRDVLSTGRPYADNHLPDEPRGDYAELFRPLRSAACAPMLSRGFTVGALWIARSRREMSGEITADHLQLLESLGDVAGSALHRAALFEQTEQRLRRLSALRAVDMAISASIDLRVTLAVLLDQVATQLQVDAAVIRILNVHSQSLAYLSGRGIQSPAVTQNPIQLGQGFAGAAALQRRVIRVPMFATQENEYARSLRESGEIFASYFVAPLLSKGKVKGVLELFSRKPSEPDEEWVEYLETMAAQAAIAIDNASLFDDLQRTNADLITAYDATIEGWSRALELRDRETEGHTLRVTDMTLRLARRLRIQEEELIHVRRGALMHDIGKMAVSDAILLKPGPLTAEEMRLMHRHPVFAYEMLYPIGYLRSAIDIPYSHHEKWDGSGYPRGLKGEQIPLAARVFAIVDVWDALRSDRPYRAAWPETKVREYLREQSGRHFDPSVVEAFFSIVDDEN